MWSNLRKIGGTKTWASNQKHLLQVMFIYILQKRKKYHKVVVGQNGTHWGNLEHIYGAIWNKWGNLEQGSFLHILFF